MNTAELLTPNQIIRSKRKSISLVIKINGEFIVRAPMRCRDEEITKFINEKSNWIIKKRIEQLNNSYLTLTFNKPEILPFLGSNFEIKLQDIKKVKLIENQIILPKFNAKEKLVSFLKNSAKKYITKRVEYIASLFAFSYAGISISSAKTCWGSCSHNNKLHFTYKLMMCPSDVIDYIVLHELCHTKFKNHSSQFWELVKKCCPDYKAHEKWLKKYRGIIELI